MDRTPRNAKRTMLFAMILLIPLLHGCSGLHRADHNPADTPEFHNPEDSLLGQAVHQHFSDNGDQSGFYTLNSGHSALQARLGLIDLAEHSVDIQTYKLYEHRSTDLLVARLFQAADRGVQVRLSLDDWGYSGDDRYLAGLAQHPNIEVRLFNPYPQRRFRFLDWFADLDQVQRRMHNKTFTVDDVVTIVGGRNLGDAYLGVNRERYFIDLDVITVGPVTQEVVRSFNQYWNHQLSLPVEQLASPPRGLTLNQQREEFADLMLALSYEDDNGLDEGDVVDTIMSGDDPFTWAQARLFVDHPDKLLSPTDDHPSQMFPELIDFIGTPQHSAFLISPYFVPSTIGMDLLHEWRDADVDIQVLTNSLSANNMPVVHAGYSSYREQLLRLDVDIWEVRPQAANSALDDNMYYDDSDYITLHEKAVIIDDTYLVLGSINLDPRSYRLNTEIGMVIKSPELAREVRTWAENLMPDVAWQLALRDDELIWKDHTNSAYDIAAEGTDPEVWLWRRLRINFYSIVPGLEGFL